MKTARPSKEGEPLPKEMAGKAIDKMADTDASPNDQASRKKRLLKGPEEFQRLERIAQNEWSHPRKIGSAVEANSFLCVSAFPSFAFSVDKAIFGIALSIKRQKRQTELVRQRFCPEKAANEMVVKRDLASFVLGCMDKIEEGERAIEK